MRDLLLLALLVCGAAAQCTVNENDPFNNCEYEYEYTSYDGWYHNFAHVEWGAIEMPLERKLGVAYSDATYEPAGYDRPNPMLISNLTQHGLTGNFSQQRSTLFIFFGQQVVEEVLDAQRPGCPPEYFDMQIPRCHPEFDRDCRGDRYTPFLRSRYDFRTGYAPGTPRQQVSYITSSCTELGRL
jgi:dual oxidase